VGEHPDVPQLVREDRIQFLCAQALEELILDCEAEGLASIGWRFDGDDECDLRFDRNVDVLRNPQLTAQTIDYEWDSLNDEGGRFRWCGQQRTREREQEERAGRRQRDP
jgi:hypothetical protein